MKVLFVNPLDSNNHEPQVMPLGLLSIATAAKNNGHDVAFVDRMVDDKNIKWFIYNFRPQIVGLSVISPRVLKDVKMISSCCRESGILVVCGGLFATLGSEALLNDRVADIVSLSEGEGSWVELLGKMENGESWKEVEGIAYLENGVYKKTPDRPFLDEKELPIIDFTFVDAGKYLQPYFDCERMTLLYSSKGCPGACTFCFNQEFHRGIHRKRSMEDVLTEIRYLQEHYNVDGIYFIDELWGKNKQEILENCRIISESGLKFVWGAQLRIGMLDKDALSYLYQCGCRWLYFGIESGCPERLKAIKKNIKVERVLTDVKNCHDVGIMVCSSVIIGYPEETEEELRQTVELCKKITKYAVNQCFIFAPTLGSEIFNELKRKQKIDNLTTLEELTRFIWDRVGENYTNVPTKDLYVVSTYIQWWMFTYRTSNAFGNIIRTIFKGGPVGAAKEVAHYAYTAVHYGRYLFLYPGVKKKYGLKLDRTKLS